jgi:SAM-dependent methyltransferase
MSRPPPEPAAPGAGAGVEFLSPPEPSDFPEEWYDLSGPEHFWFEWRLRALLRLVRDLGLALESPLRVLDVGAGAGVLRDQLEARTGWTIDIADLSAAALGRARRGRGRTLCYDVLAPAADLLARYDAALLFDVIEHVAQPRPLLAAVLRHLRPGGHLLVNVPAGQWLFSAYDVAAGHVRRYGKATLAAEIADAGLEVRDLRYWGLSLVPLLVARKLLVREAASNDACVRRGFEPPGRLAHALLRGLLRMETLVLARPPLGSSLLLAAQKRDA